MGRWGDESVARRGFDREVMQAVLKNPFGAPSAARGGRGEMADPLAVGPNGERRTGASRNRNHDAAEAEDANGERRGRGASRNRKHDAGAGDAGDRRRGDRGRRREKKSAGKTDREEESAFSASAGPINLSDEDLRGAEAAAAGRL